MTGITAGLLTAVAIGVCGFFWLRRLHRLYEAEADRDARRDREHAAGRHRAGGSPGGDDDREATR